MTKYSLISFIIYSLVGTANIVIAFVCGASIYSVVAAWLCYLAFATLIILQEITIKRMREQQKLERKIFFDFFNHSIENTKENDDDIQRNIEQN